MKILHINTSDIEGGSARSSYRIHTWLRKLGCESVMYVGNVASHDPAVKSIRGYRILSKIDELFQRLWWYLGLQDIFYLSSVLLCRRPWFKTADAILLYNLHWNYFSMLVLPAISRRKTVVLRLSDQWPMTGHCAYSKDCARWQSGCGKCPYLHDYPPLRRDRTHFMWCFKRWIYRRSNLAVVAPSKWIADCARKSPLLNRFPITLIPNGVDQSAFKPIARDVARSVLGLSGDRYYILCPANKGLTDAVLVVDCFARSSRKMDLITYGSPFGGKPKSGVAVDLGTLDDDRLLALAYSAVDLYIPLPIAENLPNAILECMACGTPVLTWDVGGISDAVVHKETGYLAKYKDLDDVQAGLNWFLEGCDESDAIRTKCVNRVRENFSAEKEARSFIDLIVSLQTGTGS